MRFTQLRRPMEIYNSGEGWNSEYGLYWLIALQTWARGEVDAGACTQSRGLIISM